ncbi:hypothetical protein VCHC68A1_02762A, partial [Vibrio cholerae HC-68A1]
MVPVAVAQEW